MNLLTLVRKPPLLPLQLPLCCSLCTDDQGWNALLISLILGCLTPWLWFCSHWFSANPPPLPATTATNFIFYLTENMLPMGLSTESLKG